jgi:hypothetical protein
VPDDLPLLDVTLAHRYEVSGIRCSAGFFEALLTLLPTGARLVLEGATDSSVQGFLEARAVLPRITVPWGTVWPQPFARHLPVDDTTLSDVAHLASDLAEPELCTHLVAYRDADALVVGYDAFAPDQPLLLAPALGEPAVAAFCERLGATYVRIPKP